MQKILYVLLVLCLSSFVSAQECSVSFNKSKEVFWTKARSEAHQAITTDLYHGLVTYAKPFNQNGNLQKVYLVTIVNPHNGRKRDAIFKPRPWGDAGGWNRTPMEYVVYEVELMLEMDYFAPVAYRYHLQVGSNYFNEGALIYFVPNLRSYRYTGSLEDKLVMSDFRVIDVLFQNTDRHKGNFGMGTHWVDGKDRPVGLDHGASLRHDGYVTLEHHDAFGNDGVKVFRRKTYESLKRLDREKMKKVDMFISKEEINRILGFRDGIIKYIEKEISLRGESNVLF